jgi:hypothetical protein
LQKVWRRVSGALKPDNLCLYSAFSWGCPCRMIGSRCTIFGKCVS